VAWRVPVVGGTAVHRHLASVGLEALLDAQRVRRARRDGTARSARRSPLDVLGRRPVPRIKEAGGAAFRRLTALQQRLRSGHRVAALLQRLADRSEILRALGAVEDVAGALVCLQGLLVTLLGLPGGVGHLDVDIERTDVLAESDKIVLRRRPNLLPFALTPRFVTKEGHRPKTIASNARRANRGSIVPPTPALP